MKLLIVESPAKAKTISKYLDNKYKVVASVGHIRDLPKSNKKAIDIGKGFVPFYEISKGKEDIVKEIKQLSKKAEEILLATDPDREGEAIAWHVAEAADIKNPKRIVFNEITKDAVKEAINHPRDIDTDLRKAQEARRVLDRLVGYDLSGLIWKKVRYGLSAGRVQSPALRIIMEKEREIRTFTPEKFWIIKALLRNEKGTDIEFACQDEPESEKKALKIIEKAKKGDWQIIGIKKTEIKRSPKAPFITSTLQQSASSRLGFSPSQTMSVAQKLYEAGLITYMRTDSTNLSRNAIEQITNIVNKKYGEKYLKIKDFKKKVKNAQEAHEAIRPTEISKESAGLNPMQQKLYKLIWQRTVASQMSEAVFERTKLLSNIKEKNIPDFHASGSIVIFDGWLLADPHSLTEEKILPETKNGENLLLQKIESEGKETQPPGRYSEAGLIKELEKRGIGRPSTYASIIKTILDRGYVEKINKALFPTDTGEVVSDFLEKNFTGYISDDFTASIENKLDDIANGQAEYKKTLEDFYAPFLKDVKEKEKTGDKITNLGDADPKYKCPICGNGMVIKLGKTGKFLSCKNFPECKGALTIEGKVIDPPREIGEKCPDCKDGQLIEREGRFGKFIACNNYPKCKYIKNSEEKKPGIGVSCPVCKEGEMSERRGRFGIFYSCNNYPKCKYAIKAKPTGNICNLCNSLMMEGTKTIPERCSNKDCQNHNPHKLKK